MGNFYSRVAKGKPTKYGFMANWARSKMDQNEPDVVRDAATQEAQRLRKRQGQAGTVVTGMSGIMSPAMILKQTLGGA